MTARYWWPLIAALGVSRPLCSSADPPEADLILHHGKIVTVDRRFSIYEAIAIQGNHILRVGKNKTVLQTRGAHTQVIDLGGKLVLPGLIDSHTHPTGASMTEFDHAIPSMET